MRHDTVLNNVSKKLKGEVHRKLVIKMGDILILKEEVQVIDKQVVTDPLALN